MFSVYPIDILHVNDNYVWAITPDISGQQGKNVYIVDPGEAHAVLLFLQEHDLELAGILLTHRHWDHVNGVGELLQHRAVPVWGPAGLQHVTEAVGEGDFVWLQDHKFDVMAIPGHTQEHIAYYCADGPQPALFCGDTLFASGCGRVFDGRVQDLHQSLTRLAQLPGNTQVYCAHEYTLANLTFARTVEPGNPAIAKRLETVQDLRNKKLPSLPSDIEQELSTNPFLRYGVGEVVESASQHAGRPLTEGLDVFTSLRHWKDNFKT